MLINLMTVEIFKSLQEVALERLVATLVEEKGGVPADLDDVIPLEGTEPNQTCVLVGPSSGDRKHPERLV